MAHPFPGSPGGHPGRRLSLIHIFFLVQDLAKIAEIAKRHHAATVIDNTYCTPIFQKPLTLGIDMVVHSASKYLGGHSDIIGGVVIGRKEDIDQILSLIHI